MYSTFTEVPFIEKPVYWFAEEINELVSIFDREHRHKGVKELIFFVTDVTAVQRAWTISVTFVTNEKSEMFQYTMMTIERKKNRKKIDYYKCTRYWKTASRWSRSRYLCGQSFVQSQQKRHYKNTNRSCATAFIGDFEQVVNQETFAFLNKSILKVVMHNKPMF